MNRSADPRRVTHLFPAFLGLRLLPVGLFFLILAIAAPTVGPVIEHRLLAGAFDRVGAGEDV